MFNANSINAGGMSLEVLSVCKLEVDAVNVSLLYLQKYSVQSETEYVLRCFCNTPACNMASSIEQLMMKQVTNDKIRSTISRL